MEERTITFSYPDGTKVPYDGQLNARSGRPGSTNLSMEIQEGVARVPEGVWEPIRVLDVSLAGSPVPDASLLDRAIVFRDGNALVIVANPRRVVLEVVDGESGERLVQAEAGLVLDQHPWARPDAGFSSASLLRAGVDGAIELPPIWGVHWARAGSPDHEWALVPLTGSDVGFIRVPLARAGAIEVTLEGESEAGSKYVELRRRGDELDDLVFHAYMDVDEWPARLDRLGVGRWQAAVLDETHAELGTAELQITSARTTKVVIDVGARPSREAKWKLHASVAIAAEWKWERARAVVRSTSSGQGRTVRDLEVRRVPSAGGLQFDVDRLENGEYWLCVLPFHRCEKFRITDADATLKLEVAAPGTLEVSIMDDADGSRVSKGSLTWMPRDDVAGVVNAFIEADLPVAGSVFVLQVPAGVDGYLDVDVDGFESPSDFSSSLVESVASGGVEGRELHIRRASPIVVLVVSNGEAIPGVEIEVLRPTDGQVFQSQSTDRSGRVQFDGLRPGDWIVRTRRTSGFRPAEERVVLRAGAAARVTFDLIRSK